MSLRPFMWKLPRNAFIPATPEKIHEINLRRADERLKSKRTNIWSHIFAALFTRSLFYETALWSRETQDSLANSRRKPNPTHKVFEARIGA
jgi:hypothetical protein